MGLTKPTAAMINFSIHNVTDPLVRINSGQTGTNDKDIGFVFERGDDANVALFWDETADQFVLVNTTEDGSTNGNVTISSYANLQVGTINTATLEIGGTAVTSTATELNLLDGVTGTLVTEAGTQTLTNKTLTAPVISSISNTGTLTLPTTTGTVALTSDIPTAVSELTNDSGYSTTTGTVTSVAGTGTVNGLSLSGTVTSSGSLTLGGTFSATVSEISDLTATAAELNYTDGVTSNIQTQLDAKSPLASPAFTGTATGVNLTLSGDLTVNGTTTTLNTTNTVVSDNLIELNNGVASNANDSGIVIERGSTGDNAIFAWDESADVFVMGTTTATGASTGDLTIATGELRLDTLRIDQSGTGLRMTNVGAFDNDGSDNFRIFATNDLQLKANGDSGGGLSIDATNNDVTIDNDLRVSAGQFYYGGTAVTSTAAELNILDGVTATTAELNYSDGVTSNIQTQLDAKASLTGTETLTNKTITSPTISNPTLTGTYTFTSDATTTPAMTLTASSLNDGVGALRIDGAQADIFLNPATATHTTVTFAVNSDQRLAFGMDNNSDFYITRRTSSTWYDDTFVLDRDTGLLSVGYGATVAGTLTYATLNDGTTALTSTVAELNYMDGVTSNVQTQLDAKAPTAGPTFTGTDGIVIPSGTTEQRPVSPATGTMRFNTTDGRFEGYNGTAWVPIDTLYS